MRTAKLGFWYFAAGFLSVLGLVTFPLNVVLGGEPGITILLYSIYVGDRIRELES